MKITRALAVALAATVLVSTGATAAQAAPTSSVSGSQSSAPQAVISVDSIKAQGFTDADIQEAIKGNPNIGIGYGPISTSTSPVSSSLATARGVTFGKYIYVRISKAQAKAINQASAAASIEIIGGLTGGVGAIVAAAVYGYVVSLGNSGLDRCANWQFDVSYPLPGIPSRIIKSQCI